MPVIAGSGSNSTEEAIMLTRHAKDVGADGALVVTPYYNKPTQEGLFQHFKALNDSVNIPIVIYNIPSRSVIDMSVSTMAKLATLPNIVGVKDATNDVSRATLQKRAAGDDFVQLSGEDGTQLGFSPKADTDVYPSLLMWPRASWLSFIMLGVRVKLRMRRGLTKNLCHCIKTYFVRRILHQ